MKDPWFERALVLLIQHGDEGAIGLVVNKEGRVSIGEVVEKMDLDPPVNASAPTWWGGPVAQGAGFVIWRGDVDGDEGWTLSAEGKAQAGNIAISPSVERLSALVEAGQRFHLCLGHSGWAPAQLDAEIERGSWLYVDLDPDLVFDTPLPERYDRALGALGLTAQTVWMTPINE